MLIAVVGTKGSQGKSTISHAIAYEKGFGIITNDIDSSVDEFLPEERVIKLRNDDELPEIPDDVWVVFDGKAGIDEPVVKQAIQKADWVIVPTIYEVEELKRALRGIKQVEQLIPETKTHSKACEDLTKALTSFSEVFCRGRIRASPSRAS